MEKMATHPSYPRYDLHMHTPLSHCGKLPSLTAGQVFGLMEEAGDFYRFRDEVTMVCLAQVLQQGERLGLSHVGLSDHFPEHREHAPVSWEKIRAFTRARQSPVKILLGAECSIQDGGKVLMTSEERACLDYALGAPFHWSRDLIHGRFGADLGKAMAFVREEILAALENPLIDGLVHVFPISGSPSFCDFDTSLITPAFAREIGEKAKAQDKALEISARFDYSGNSPYLCVLEQWFLSGCNLFLGSDAHSPDRLGHKTNQALALLEAHSVAPKRLWIPGE